MMIITIKHVISKIMRETYRLFHPYLWNKGLQLNGIPKIYSADKLKIGCSVSINDDVVIQCGGGTIIGDRVTLSRGVVILTVGYDTSNWQQNCKKISREHNFKPVRIGRGTWICANSTICPGAEIPDGCIIAAGSVVSGRLKEKYALYGGIPAKFIKWL